jgi:hypothetical protein
VVPEVLANSHGQGDKPLEELPDGYRIQPQKVSENSIPGHGLQSAL